MDKIFKIGLWKYDIKFNGWFLVYIGIFIALFLLGTLVLKASIFESFMIIVSIWFVTTYSSRIKKYKSKQ